MKHCIRPFGRSTAVKPDKAPLVLGAPGVGLASIPEGHQCPGRRHSIERRKALVFAEAGPVAETGNRHVGLSAMNPAAIAGGPRGSGYA